MIVCRIIYCTAVLLATASVILLAIFSPLPYRDYPHSRPILTLSFYIQQPQVGGVAAPSTPPSGAEALIFHRILTEGLDNASQVVGKAQGFIIPVESFAHSAFNIIYLTFHTKEYSGSVSVEAKNLGHRNLAVVGGTGAFAFARGHAIFAKINSNNNNNNVDASHHIKLQLNYPKRTQLILG